MALTLVWLGVVAIFILVVSFLAEAGCRPGGPSNFLVRDKKVTKEALFNTRRETHYALCSAAFGQPRRVRGTYQTCLATALRQVWGVRSVLFLACGC